jgi:hypothetical protein
MSLFDLSRKVAIMIGANTGIWAGDRLAADGVRLAR